MKIQTVSSRWTFLFKLALPLFWLVVMGSISLIVLLSPLETLKEPFSPLTAKLLVVSFFLSILGLLYFLFGKAKWVGMDEQKFYVSNFFMSYKYTYNSIAHFEELNMLLFTAVVVHFHQPTKFGKSVFFVKSYYWKYFLEKHPHILDVISGKNPSMEIGTVTEELN